MGNHRVVSRDRLRSDLIIAAFRFMFMMAISFLANQTLRAFGLDLWVLSVWWDIAIICIGILIYNIIFDLFGVKIHVTDRSGVIKSTISGHFFKWRHSRR